MKSVTFKNRLTGEHFVCENVRDVRSIDGVEYLVVHRATAPGRTFLMKRDALERVIPTKNQVSH